MRYAAICITFLFPLIVSAQPALESRQQEWADKLTRGQSVVHFYWSKGPLLYLNNEAKPASEFIERLKNVDIGPINRYEHIRQFEHDKNRYLTIGYLLTGKKKIMLLSAWQTVKGDWKKEIDLMLTQSANYQTPADSVISQLETERKQWITLANRHDPEAHIAYSYAADAIYFSNGRRSDGHTGITKRYAYMKNPNYRVELEGKYLHQLSDQKIVEVGRYYAGSRKDNPGGVYMILWEKREGQRWQIALDFNF